MTTKEQFLSKHQRYRPISLPQNFSDEEMARDWTLSASDKEEISKYRKNSRLFVAVQLCSVRLYGRFLNQVHDLSPHIMNYLGRQLDLPPSLAVEVPERKATYTDHRQNILKHLGFQKFDEVAQDQLEGRLKQQAHLGLLPNELFQKAGLYLLEHRILLPGPSMLERGSSSTSVPMCMCRFLMLFFNDYRLHCGKPLIDCSRCPKASNALTFTTSKNTLQQPPSRRCKYIYDTIKP